MLFIRMISSWYCDWINIHRNMYYLRKESCAVVKTLRRWLTIIKNDRVFSCKNFLQRQF